MGVQAKLERLIRQAQARGRIPGLTVAVHRQDRPLWTFQVGTSGRPDLPLTADTLFRMGSITKTFTAVLVMQCRDEGLLDLDDPVGVHLDVPALGESTVRRLLSHSAGVQREPHGDVWDQLAMPGAEQLLAELDHCERVLPPGRRFHYSNLGLAMLGHLVGRLRGGSWAEVLRDRVLDPLGLADVAVDPGERAAVGFLVDAHSDHAAPEPPIDAGGIGPAAQLWSSAADLAKWTAFLADPATVDPTGAVLPPATVEEMRAPATVINETDWAAAFGLGLLLVPRGSGVVHIGHDGAMPGFLAAAYGRRGGDGTPKALGVAALGSSGTAGATVELPHTLLDAVVAEDPADVEAWVPGEPVPPPYRSVLGRWWSEGFEFAFFWRDGGLQARRMADPADRPPAVFTPIDDAAGRELRTVSGREAGERLRLHRDPSTGDVVRMNWATYRFTRVQETFEGRPAGEG